MKVIDKENNMASIYIPKVFNDRFVEIKEYNEKDDEI